jgi:ribose/xylose/arabinose/galactoside ABC-type transport system permease subunit
MRGTLNYITSGNWIDGLGGAFSKFSNIRFLNIPLAVYIWLVVLVFTYFLLFHTCIGRDFLAVGGNKVAAKRIGVCETKVNLLVFGYRGYLPDWQRPLLAKLKIAQPSNGTGYEMQLIAAAVIGGTAFSGGCCIHFWNAAGCASAGLLLITASCDQGAGILARACHRRGYYHCRCILCLTRERIERKKTGRNMMM